MRGAPAEVAARDREERGGGKLVVGEETFECVPPHQICWGWVGSKGEGETKTR